MKFMTYSIGQMLFEAVLKVGDDPNFKLLNDRTKIDIMTIRSRCIDAAAEVEALLSVVEQARSTYCTDEIEIDDQPVLSVADGGVWVSAWVWVETPDEGNDE